MAKKAGTALLSSAAFLFAVCLISQLLHTLKFEIFFGSFCLYDLISVLWGLCGISLVFGVFLRFSKRLWLGVIAGVLISLLISAVAAFGFLWDCNYVYHSFTSDDGRVLVVKEQSFLLAGWGDIYVKTAPFVIKHVGDYISDDGFMPVSADCYEVEWGDEEVIFRYNDAMHPEMQQIRVEY